MYVTWTVYNIHLTYITLIDYCHWTTTICCHLLLIPKKRVFNFFLEILKQTLPNFKKILRTYFLLYLCSRLKSWNCTKLCYCIRYIHYIFSFILENIHDTMFLHGGRIAQDFWGVICLLYFYICYLIIMWAIFPSHSSDCWDFFKTFYWNHFTFQVLHYVEKPETFVSSIINCGVYLFTPTIFNHIKEGFEKLQNEMRSACLRLIIR